MELLANPRIHPFSSSCCIIMQGKIRYLETIEEDEWVQTKLEKINGQFTEEFGLSKAFEFDCGVDGEFN